MKPNEGEKSRRVGLHFFKLIYIFCFKITLQIVLFCSVVSEWIELRISCPSFMTGLSLVNLQGECMFVGSGCVERMAGLVDMHSVS